MTNEECCIRMKMWLLMGSQVDDGDPQARTKHLEIDISTIDLWSPEELEALKPPEEEIPSGSE